MNPKQERLWEAYSEFCKTHFRKRRENDTSITMDDEAQLEAFMKSITDRFQTELVRIGPEWLGVIGRSALFPGLSRDGFDDACRRIDNEIASATERAVSTATQHGARA